MATKRKGAAKGSGSGYKNLPNYPKDPKVHSMSAKGMKQPQNTIKMINKRPAPDFSDLQAVSWIALSRPWVGGYSAITKDSMNVSASFFEPQDLFELAKKFNINEISLAGDWSRWGEKGYGQKVSIKRAMELSKLDKPLVI